jgi:hypothetical protein
VSAVLQELRRSGVRLGIVSNIGQETEEGVRRVLEKGQIYDLFEPSLLIYGEKDSPEIFRRAAEQPAQWGEERQSWPFGRGLAVWRRICRDHRWSCTADTTSSLVEPI